MQYAAGFGKSNIIGWTALQLKDLRRNGEYVYDKIMIVVDRLQLRSQIDAKMLNMNIDMEPVRRSYNKATFQQALESDTRIVIVNLQKFGSVKEMIDAEVLQRLAHAHRLPHRRKSPLAQRVQSEEMITSSTNSNPFDTNATYSRTRTKRTSSSASPPPRRPTWRALVNSAAMPKAKTLAPFDSYTMLEAIEDGYILNPSRTSSPSLPKCSLTCRQ
jgi:type I restriction enzyme R subunit